jgi:hypothetical protein
VRERGRGDLVVARGQLLDAAVREGGQVVRGATQRVERGPSRLVRKGDGDLGAARERLEQRPLGPGQVLEPVREDRPAVPGVEVVLDALDGVAPPELAVPDAEPVELRPIGRMQPRQVALELSLLDEAGLELGEGASERVGEAREARRGREAVQRGRRDGGADCEPALDVADDGALVVSGSREPPEDIVEGADVA